MRIKSQNKAKIEPQPLAYQNLLGVHLMAIFPVLILMATLLWNNTHRLRLLSGTPMNLFPAAL